MKVNKKLLALSSSIILLPVLFGLYAWQDLPNRMATHFGPTGQADSWASKPFVILFIPLFLLGLHLFGIFVTNRDPKSQMTSLKIRYLVYAIVPFMSSFFTIYMYRKNLGYAINTPLFVGLAFGFFFIVIGNYLPKIRQNYTVGLRFPWNINDEGSWNHTHRLAGFLWVLGGLIIIVDGFIDFAFVWVFFGSVILMVLLPIINSYLYYRKHR
ncbi:SdpI family protein [Streptococcus sobrinus]|uniref:SdpI family protein n=1 Tax=Streptococcus sobrinus TaxID=1310 RepID=UPI000D7056BD|nr:SdpI family protein [Streptococcus sobrinus]AWN61249.1 immunity protein [Streptococcus sobrinus]AWN63122.1 immunity protein [Streptococcus sobrinus]SQG19328.1 hemolysis inducing protein [Streptococcus sobrinus]